MYKIQKSIQNSKTTASTEEKKEKRRTKHSGVIKEISGIHHCDEMRVKLEVVQDCFIMSSEKLKHGVTLTTSQVTITRIKYFNTQRTVMENTKVT